MGRLQAEADPHRRRAGIDDQRLADPSHARGQGLADNQGAARRRADHVAVQHAKVALPDGREAIEDGHEQHALRQDAGRQEIEVGAAADVEASHMRHDLPEQQQPEDRLHGAADEVEGVVAQLGHFRVGHGEDLGQIASDDRQEGRLAQTARLDSRGHRSLTPAPMRAPVRLVNTSSSEASAPSRALSSAGEPSAATLPPAIRARRSQTSSASSM